MVESIAGRNGWRSAFDVIADRSELPTKLTLQSVEKFDNDVLWLRYNIIYNV